MIGQINKRAVDQQLEQTTDQAESSEPRGKDVDKKLLFRRVGVLSFVVFDEEFMNKRTVLTDDTR